MSERKKDDFPKVVQICHGPIIPEYVSAYSLRCNSLFHDLDSTILSVGGPIFRDKRVPKVSQFRSIFLTGYSALKGKRTFEIALAKGKFLRQHYKKTVENAIQNSNVVVFEGPWQYYLFKHLLGDKLVVYDAHNCETQLREGNVYHDFVKQLETELVMRSDIVFSVAQRDYENLKSMGSESNTKFYLMPHLLPRIPVSWNGLQTRNICFIGSMYGPNISALKFILDLSKELPGYNFNIIGSVGSAPQRGRYPNVNFLGLVSEQLKNEFLSETMFAVNPVVEGSGRNLKMIDYFLHRVPVISTKIGVRGFEDYLNAGGVIVAELNEFKKLITEFDHQRDKLVKLSEASGNTYELIFNNEINESTDDIIREFVKNIDS